MKIGMGYDVHRLASEHKLVLGGVEIPFSCGLVGWSDADVLTHAVIDAVLGAAGLGDIGTHFPPGDLKFKGISSLFLLETVMLKVRAKGYKVSNVDVSVVAEQPKLANYIGAMCHNLARAMMVDAGQVNIKANTNEELGFVGREEGMVAWAVALLE